MLHLIGVVYTDVGNVIKTNIVTKFLAFADYILEQYCFKNTVIKQWTINPIVEV